MNIDINQLKQTFSIEEKEPGKYSLQHKQCKIFKLFPFDANTSSSIIENLTGVAGGFIRYIQGKEKIEINFDDVQKKIIDDEDITVKDDDKVILLNMIKTLFFDENKKLLPLNLEFCKYIDCCTSEEKIASYIFDTLSNDNTIEKLVESKISRYKYNVLENYLTDKLPKLKDLKRDTNTYFPMCRHISSVFMDDFSYMLKNANVANEYFVDFLELYYFHYTTQICFKLKRFFSKSQEENTPLYFSVDWEKTGKNRNCYNYGWQYLQPELKNMFSHAVVLEMLNQDKSLSNYDYSLIADDLAANPHKDDEYSAMVRSVSDLYLNSISDCEALNRVERKNGSHFKTEMEIRYLFDCIKKQFEESVRKRANDAYTQKFENFCKQRRLKNRRTMGLMLNLTERDLLFLTQISIKDEERMKLNKVFEEFEKRGVFLDNSSKASVAEYYEKLNLIEKKSDSGDAQYVKRIL